MAGLQAAQTLRRAEFTGSITMIGAEDHLPYDRPPLSKQFLTGKWDEDKIRLRAAIDPDALGLDWRLGVRATGLDTTTRTVTVSDGSQVNYDGLVIATGTRARALPNSDLAGVFTLRTLDDARSLKAAFDAGPQRVLVIGAGFIGAEVAATARELGLEVTMIEAAPAPLMRVCDIDSGMAIAALHEANGVDVRLGTGVDSLLGDTAVTGALLSDGSTIEATVVVVGIGAIPNTEWLEGSGLTIDNGVVCDATCLAGPGIVAAGDVARWPNNRFGGELTRVEQWDNALDQGAYAARRLLAEAAGESVEPFMPVPWFWSDQYDRKIQLAGKPSNNAQVVHGSVDDFLFVKVFADDDGEFTGALAWNRPRHAIVARQLIEAGTSLADAIEKLTP